jgi:hypothetical protein
MSSLVLLAGYTGTGKTTIARKYKTKALCIGGDEIHCDAARRAFPYIRKKDIYNWKSWPIDPETMHLELLLFATLYSVCPMLREHTGSVLIEGAILANSWFRDALINAMAATGRRFSEENIHMLYLRPGAEEVFANIQGRLAASEGRENERRRLTSLEKVAASIESYSRAFKDDRWSQFSTHAEVHNAIENIINNASDGRPGKPVMNVQHSEQMT